MIKLEVYHGRENHHNEAKGDKIFFSTEESFSMDYGEVKKYQLELENPFDSANEKDVEKLISKVGSLEDGYDDSEYFNFSELEENGLSDTWEIFEPHMYTIGMLGYDSLIIYEGGIKNFVSFRSDQYKLIG